MGPHSIVLRQRLSEPQEPGGPAFSILSILIEKMDCVGNFMLDFCLSSAV